MVPTPTTIDQTRVNEILRLHILSGLSVQQITDNRPDISASEVRRVLNSRDYYESRARFVVERQYTNQDRMHDLHVLIGQGQMTADEIAAYLELPVAMVLNQMATSDGQAELPETWSHEEEGTPDMDDLDRLAAQEHGSDPDDDPWLL